MSAGFRGWDSGVGIPGLGPTAGMAPMLAPRQLRNCIRICERIDFWLGTGRGFGGQTRHRFAWTSKIREPTIRKPGPRGI